MSIATTKFMTWSLLAARPIDFAIFFSMGGLWLFGGAFIYFLWRWIVRFEIRTGSTFGQTPGMRKAALERAKPQAKPEQRRNDTDLSHPVAASTALPMS